jgi:SAM-dependent methyltransferase
MMTNAARLSDAPFFDLTRWDRPLDAVELSVLEMLTGPVLDVGCGPGRFVEALVARGVDALGLDAAPAAVSAARARGVPVAAGSVFGPVPAAGTWATVLLMDGNLGIGGDPVRLLRRSCALLAPGGCVVAELAPPDGARGRGLVRIEVETSMIGWFPWCWVGRDDIGPIAAAADLRLELVVHRESRSFCRLSPAPRAATPARAPQVPGDSLLSPRRATPSL